MLRIINKTYEEYSLLKTNTNAKLHNADVPQHDFIRCKFKER